MLELIQPRCLHFGSCGGCSCQDLDYAHQLHLKQKTVHELISPFLDKDSIMLPIVGCSEPWRYRNKMEFTFRNAKENQFLGLIMKNSRGHVINLSECHLVDNWFMEVLGLVRNWWKESGLTAFNHHKGIGSLRTLTVREGKHTGDRLVMLTVSGNPEYALGKEQLEAFVKAVRGIEPRDPHQKLSIILKIHQAIKGIPTQFFEMRLYGEDHLREELHIGEKKFSFRISPSAFFQPNTFKAQELYAHALSFLKMDRESILYDLYCGTATLGICSADKVKKVVGIELSPDAVVDARENIKLNHVENIELHQGDVGKVLAELNAREPIQADIVIVDPPRSGLDQKAIENILSMNAPQLLYISCNPATQAANLETLISKGYRLKVSQAVDQFPQNFHIENCCYLTR